MDGVSTVSYASENLIRKPVPWSIVGTKLSPFDEKLRQAWDKAANEGIFRYTLTDCLYKDIDLKIDESPSIPCVAQLNPQRGVNRRKRDEYDSMNDPFDEEKFNFKKIKNTEILFRLLSNDGHITDSDHYVIINISPIEYGHVLLVPCLQQGLAQHCTTDSLLLAFDMLQLSSQPSFRIGFNSIHAWASINHLHFHGMYCDHEIFCDSLPAEKQLTGSCYLFHPSSPLQAFVFVVPEQREDRFQGDQVEIAKPTYLKFRVEDSYVVVDEEILDDSGVLIIASSVSAITDVLHSMECPYNIIITRGQLWRSDGTRSDEWVTRTLIFPRKSSKGLLPVDSFDVACVEVGGHFPVKTREGFETLTAEVTRSTLVESRLEDDVFDIVKEKVKEALK